MSQEKVDPAPELAAYVAIDWADQKHDWALREAGTEKVEQGQIENTPEAVEVWAGALAQRFGGRPVAVCLEQKRGALVYMLTKYEHLVLYPVHPASLANYRKAFYPSGAKDDPKDTRLLLELLERHRDRLQQLELDTVETRTVQFLVEDRRRIVDDKTRLKNRLTARLKLYFPQMLTWFDDVDTELVEDFLKRWPTLAELQKARPSTLKKFFHQHNCRSQERNEQRLREIGEAIPATRDQAVIQAGVSLVKILVASIATARRGIAELERQIAQLSAAHEDYAIFDSLPGAGPALAPRLLAALGTRRERYQSAGDIHCQSGIAPVITRSGKQQWIHFRWACSKFLRQSFHEWAWHSVSQSEWAREFYEQHRAHGKDHHATVRALAFKWIRILFRCWQDRTLYDEKIYQESLRKRAGQKQPGVTFQWNSCASFSKLSGLSS